MREEMKRHMRIFHPYTIQQVERVSDQKIRFVHYSTAEAAINIIKKGEVWMRKSSCMNDFMEVEHGGSCLSAAYKSDDAGKTFKETLDKIHDGLSKDVEKLFDGWWPHLQSQTYLVSFSEHDDSEDHMGRLSMWRAYGSGGGVALVMNSEAFFNESEALKAYTSPVAYLDLESFKEKFEEVTRLINDNREFLSHYTRDQMRDSIYQAFKYAVLCTKHPGFKEEREWRVVYNPVQAPSPNITQELVTIDGVPQNIQKIPLKNIPEEGLVDIEIPELIDRVIIGPTNYPSALHEAFVDVLTEAKVPNAAQKVWASDIPLRR